ncbi:uncharacterized protein LOC5519668 isoform X2 [Nematostella vectensis]|uniref:uncharacterized protein LOC5519668 isoform X2 n=1 Tax=Nematostella vectensis TaxID=45351 RepID=UPI002077902B|nr:uncharacterized protein LOC5519668 isoform X2 [Nematostella vectensis]
MLEPEVLDPEELSAENLESFFEDETFVDYFNTFLALPCFAERLFFNKEIGLFEEFVQKLADDVGEGDAQAASQLRNLTHFKGTIYNVTNNETRIGYYVSVLDKAASFKFVLENRIPLFLKSELYAEYKLSLILSTVQASLLGDFTGEEEFNDIRSGSQLSRQRSVVSFNLGSPEREYSAGSRNADSPHIRSIEETFGAWQDSFRQADSRASLYNYADASLMSAPEIREPESESCSESSEFDNNDLGLKDEGRPQSRMSYLSDVSAESNAGSQIGSMDTTLRDEIDIDMNSEIDESVHQSVQEKSEIENNNDSLSQNKVTKYEDKESQDSNSNPHRTQVNTESKQETCAGEEGTATENSDSVNIAQPSPGAVPPRRVTTDGPRFIEGQFLRPKSGLTVETIPEEAEDSDNYSSRSPSITGNSFSAQGCDSVFDAEAETNRTTTELAVGNPDDSGDTCRKCGRSLIDVDEQNSEDLCESCVADASPDNSKSASDDSYANQRELPDHSASRISFDDNFEISYVEREKGTEEPESHTGAENKEDIDKDGSPDGNDDDTDDTNCSDGNNSGDEDDVVSANDSDGNDNNDNIDRDGVVGANGNNNDDVTDGARNSGDDGDGSIGGDAQDDRVGPHSPTRPASADTGGGEDTESNSVFTLQGIRGILSSRRHSSIAATSIGFDLDQESDYDEDEDDEDDRPYDLSTKDGMDEFKEFLIGTNGEKHLRLWVDVECAKHLYEEQDKQWLAGVVRERYWNSGALYELTTATKRRLEIDNPSKVTFTRLMDAQHCVLEPITAYWCPRFTMHQQRRRVRGFDLEYNRLMAERPKSCFRRVNELSNLPQEPESCGLSRITCAQNSVTCSQVSAQGSQDSIRCAKQWMRPQSSRVPMGEKARPVTAKKRIRSKSAHPRLIPASTPMHTNASTTQLQNILVSVRKGYGYNEVKPASFPSEVIPEYHSSVRLYINPVPTPHGKVQKMLRLLHRTAVSADNPQPIRCAKQREASGGNSMDALIEGLILEKQTGGYFEAFLRRLGNKLWVDCLEFWKSLQDYNAYFFADSLNPSVLAKKARSMYARFIVGGGCQSIGLSNEIQDQVAKQLEPAYEELFDAVEDHALHCLLEPWQMLQKDEEKDYVVITKEQKLCHLELKMLPRRRQSIVQAQQAGFVDEDVDKDKITIEEANSPMPVPKDGFSFDVLIRSRKEIEYFKEFLNKKHTKGIKDLMAWTDMETFRRIPKFMEDKRDKKAVEVRNSWLSKKYFFGNDSPASREGQHLIMNVNGGRVIKERPTSPVITEAQKFVRARIERRWLLLFKQTAEFLDRQKPKVSAPEVVEDILLKRRLQRSEAAWKILNSRWVSSSRDVVALRNQLLNPSLCSEFKTFVALKGETFENDVDFWLEVQKFKDLCHTNAHDGLIRRKVQAINECFLNSAISPELQIDIPIEMAEKLVERLTARHLHVHPYIFREAQMTVFRVLFNHWKEFVAYRSKANPANQTLLQHLEDQLRKQRADVRAKREASERRRMARLSAERRRKDKEERERKRMEDLASLFSLETASIFYSEEDEVSSWHYSKHIVEMERQEHIRRLRAQGIVVPDDAFLETEKEDTKSRRSRLSVAAKSSNLQEGKPFKLKNKNLSGLDGGSDKKSSDRISARNVLLRNLKKQHADKAPQSPLADRRGSIRSQSPCISTTRRGSVISQKSARFSLTGKDEKKPTEGKEVKHDDTTKPEREVAREDTKKDVKVKQEKCPVKVQEIQVIPNEPSEYANDFAKALLKDEEPQQKARGKLLSGRTQKNKRMLLSPGKVKGGTKGVPLDAISCISDYSIVSNIDYPQRGQVVTPPKQLKGSASQLTLKSLKDFTDSPEGAPLAVPLPLVRITSASQKELSDGEGSQGDPALASFRPRRQHIITMATRKSSARERRKMLGTRNSEPVVTPDVIVN